MDDVVLMAVVDALKNLLHEHGSVTLRELTSLQDLIEELSSLADPKSKNQIRKIDCGLLTQ